MYRARQHDPHLPRNAYFPHRAYGGVKTGKWTAPGISLKHALTTYAARYEANDRTMAALIAEALPIITQEVKPATACQYKSAAAELTKALVEFKPQDVMPRRVAGRKRACGNNNPSALHGYTLAAQAFRCLRDLEETTSS